MTKKKIIAPAFGSLVKISEEGWAGVPDGPNPFFVGTGEGLFVHKRMLIGRGLAKTDKNVSIWPKFGNYKGDFIFEADPIPARLMGQVVNFFERTYDRQHTEAAVLLIMHAETKEWRVFIPTQLVSHGGVNYVFDPAHIQYPWVIVGSIHSHCDFGAGHSGTDTNDADGFDGLHCTIGFIKRETPMIVAMVAMNKQLFHYADKDFPYLFDYSEAKQHEAPAWWDRYVENTITKEKPVGFDLYKRFDKPTVVKEEKKVIASTGYTPPITLINKGFSQKGFNRFTPTDWVYDEKKKMMVKKNGEMVSSFPALRTYVDAHSNYSQEDWDNFYANRGITKEPDGYEGFLPQELVEAGYRWNGYIKNWEYEGPSKALIEKYGDKEDEILYGIYEKNERDDPEFWESKHSLAFLDSLFDTDLVTEGDLDFAFIEPNIAGTEEYWLDIIWQRILAGAQFLQENGIEINISLEDGPPGLLPKETDTIHLMKGLV